MARAKSSRFRHETAMYFLFCDKVLKDVAFHLEMKRDDLVCFMWAYYINKYVFNSDYFRLKETVEIIKKMNVVRYCSYAYLNKLLRMFYMKQLLNKVGDRYVLDFYAGGMMKRLASGFTERVGDFEMTMENPDTKKIFPKVKRKYNKNPKGWPKYIYKRKRGKRKRKQKETEAVS
jgi:hypothetical protein